MKFKKSHFNRLAAVMLLSWPLLATANTPPDLYKLKAELVKYHDSGQYAADIHKLIVSATEYVKRRVVENNQLAHPKKLAAVFDIDESALSNYSDMVRMDFGGTSQAQGAAEDLGRDPAITDVLNLYNYCKANGVTLFLITGRKDHLQHDATVRNMQAAGYTDWKHLSMKPDNYALPSVVLFKAGARAKIVAQGYDIILNIGDQWSDLKGGFADKTFKVPNPYYFIP